MYPFVPLVLLAFIPALAVVWLLSVLKVFRTA